jgi:serine/threonine protein kinase
MILHPIMHGMVHMSLVSAKTHLPCPSHLLAGISRPSSDRIMHAASDDPNSPLYYTIKLVDFGLAKLTENAQTALKTTCGTPYFLAPEIIDNATPTYGAEVDIW